MVLIQTSRSSMKVEIEIPEWANWMAQDEDGKWYCFVNKPKPRGVIWNDGGFALMLYRGKPSPDWREELYKIVRE